jgi:phage baseplate assembly protein W
MKSIFLPFQFKNGQVATVGDFDSIIKQEILDNLAVSRQERVMHPDYGVGVYGMLYEMVDPLVWSDFKQMAISEISSNVTGATIYDITISTGDQPQYGDTETAVSVSVSYQIAPSQKSSVTLSVSDILSEENYA